MLVKDLHDVLFDTEKVTIVVFDDGKEISRDSEITFEYATRIYHDYEIWHIFTICVDEPVICIYVREPDNCGKVSPELQGIIECYEEFFEYADSCGVGALL